MEIFTPPATRTTSETRKLTRGGAALLLVASMASCSKPSPVCDSPREISKAYAADPHATADRSTWTNGVAIHTTPPEGAEGIVVGFRAPGKNDWQDSEPIAPQYASAIAVRLGNGAVTFSVSARAHEGDAACTAAVGALFSGPQPIGPVIAAGATQPTWRPVS